MTKKQSMLPAEVEGLVEMMSDEIGNLLVEYEQGHKGLTLEAICGLISVLKDKYAPIFLSRINEHLGGRAVILSKDQTAPENPYAPYADSTLNWMQQIGILLTNVYHSAVQDYKEAGGRIVSCAIDGTEYKEK